jgi:hypothetical protein
MMVLAAKKVLMLLQGVEHVTLPGALDDGIDVKAARRR